MPTDFTGLDFVYSLKLEPTCRSYSAYRGSRTLIRDDSLATVLESIESNLEHTIAKHSREHLFLHAGVIEWRGRTVLFPGRTCSGKSTLIQALIRAGAVYFSDEFARIDSQGLVHPFPRPLSLRACLGKATLNPKEEGLKIATDPCPVGAIISTQYAEDGVWCPKPLSPGQAALQLLNNTVAVRLDPAKAVRYAGILASSAAAICSPRGEANATAPLLLQTLDTILD